MKKLITSMVVSLSLIAGILGPVGIASALTSQNVTVTGTPSYVAITNTPSTWTINGLNASSPSYGYMLVNTTYYSNPLGDTTSPSATVLAGECNFTVTNASSSVPLDLTVNFGNFSGSVDAMNNSDSGSATATEFGASSYCTDMAYPTGIKTAKVTGSDAMKTNWTTASLKWGLIIETRTDAWTTGDAQTATVTLTATAH